MRPWLIQRVSSQCSGRVKRSAGASRRRLCDLRPSRTDCVFCRSLQGCASPPRLVAARRWTLRRRQSLPRSAASHERHVSGCRLVWLWGFAEIERGYMGAWGSGHFENDDAMDWVWELEADRDGSVVRAALGAVAELADLPSTWRHLPPSSAIAAAAVVAKARWFSQQRWSRRRSTRGSPQRGRRSDLIWSPWPKRRSREYAILRNCANYGTMLIRSSG